jgi:HK97 family phage major capsid protein
MARIGDIIEERANLVTEMRTVLDTAETESRDLTAEERQEYDRREARVRELEGDIRRHEQAQRAEDLDVREFTPAEEGEPEDRTLGTDSDEYRDALMAYVRGEELSAEQRTTLNVGTDADGGFAVPEFWTSLYEGLRQFGVVRGAATVVTTEMGGDLHVPKVSADATTPAIEPEQDPIADDGETFAEVVIGAYKYARITKASEEIVQDALFDVPSFVGRRLGEDLALATGAAYVNGTGTNQPQGLFTGATVADTLAANGAITADEVIDLVYSVIAPYRVNGVFVLNDTTIAAIRKLKDANDQYLWQVSLQAGQPDTLLGYPVLSDPNVASLGAAVGSKVVGFGNVARAFTIRDVLGVTIKFLDQLYAGNDQVGWRGKLRTSSAVIDANAFKVLNLPA